MNLIEIQDVSKRYSRKTKALNHITLNIKEGMFGILGRNGSGKSTLMNILATLLKPTDGQVTINGIPTTNATEVRKLIGYLPQDFDFYPNMSVKDTLHYLGALSEINSKSIAHQIDIVLEKVNLTKQKSVKVKNLSGGMKKRLGIAQAIIHNPKVIIVDEPTAGLDPEERVRLRNLLSDLAENKIVIISTHIVSDIESTCNEIAILEKGTLAYSGSLNDLITLSNNKVYETTIPASSLDDFKRKSVFITKIMENDNHLRLRFVSDEQIENAHPVKQDFEDAYMYFLKTKGGN